MEENLIHGEIEEELESRANGGSYSERKTAVQMELRGAELENYGVEPVPYTHPTLPTKSIFIISESDTDHK